MHRFMGRDILPTTSDRAAAKWYIETHHADTGVPMDEAYCPSFASVSAAKQHIRDDAARSQAAAVLGAAGGRSKSEAKRLAVQANGAKGGRPRKERKS